MNVFRSAWHYSPGMIAARELPKLLCKVGLCRRPKPHTFFWRCPRCGHDYPVIG